MATNPQVFDFDIGDVTGKKGDTGNGIKSIVLLSTSGLVKTYRITMTDDTTFDFSVSDGSDGDDGNGISGASFDAETNALTITFDDGTSFTTPSLKGAPGSPGTDGVSPAVAITTITGGHRVTITDKTHPTGQSFDVMDGQGGGGGTSDYTDLTNKPKINGHTLDGNQSAADLGLGTYSKPSGGIPKTDLAQGVQQSLNKADSALQTAPVQSVAGKTGAVNLGAGDVGFNSSEEYNEGTVGAELSTLNRQLSDDEVNEMLMNSSIPGTTETVTFDTNNKPANVTHTASGVAVRTDVFTWGTNSVTEVRTLANGKHVTLVTNLTTLVTTISEIQEAG